MNKLLEIKNLHTHFKTDFGTLKALDGVSFSIERGKIQGIVGESGCGKSVTARTILQILGKAGTIPEGKILFHKKNGSSVDIAKLDPRGKEIKRIRGNDISMIFQEPMTAFSPVYSIGNQIMEAVLLHQKVDKSKAKKIAVEFLLKVGIPNADLRIDAYPYEMSGGMRQRAMIAMALCCHPSLLIADEPTTALDVTIQAQILDLMVSLQKEIGMSIMLITHDLGVIAETADKVAVMYLGKIVEEASVNDIFHNPAHPYTRALLDSIPRVEEEKEEWLTTIKGFVPDLYNIPRGCAFHPRCSKYMEGVCNKIKPTIMEIEEDHTVSCLLYRKDSK